MSVLPPDVPSLTAWLIADEIIYVGAAGLLVNVLGMVMLGGHGHSHAGGGHGHSHGGGGGGGGANAVTEDGCDHGHGHGATEPDEKQAEHGDLNMHAAWLHAMGDMLGSIVVVAVGLIIEFAEGKVAACIRGWRGLWGCRWLCRWVRCLFCRHGIECYGDSKSHHVGVCVVC